MDNSFKYKQNKIEKARTNQVFFSNFKWLFLILFVVLPIIGNLVFNIQFHFNPNKYGNAPANSIDYNYFGLWQFVYMLTISFVQIVAFCYLLFKFKNYFIQSTAIILCIFWIGLQLILPLAASFIINPIFTNSTNANIAISALQIIFYILIILYFFIFCKIGRARLLSIFKRNSRRDNWTLYLQNKKISTKKSYDVVKIIVLVVGGSVCAFTAASFISSVIKTNIIFNTSNQNNINNLLKSTGGKIVLIPLIVVFAPIVEELATRQGIITPLFYKNSEINYMKKESFGESFYTKSSIMQIIWFFIIVCLTSLFFANMHIINNNFTELTAYLATSFVFTFIFIFSGLSVGYSIGAHALYNLIVLILQFTLN